MKKIKTLLLLCMLGGMALFGTTACSGDDDSVVTPDAGVKLRHITIREADGSAVPRRLRPLAVLTDGEDLSATWTAGDRLAYCNLSRMNPMTEEVYSGMLTATASARISPFTGDVVCRAGDYLAVVYPAVSFEANDGYHLSLTGQDGTLATLATSYHYVYGKALVTSVTDQSAEATMDKMKSLLTVCKFSFVDKATGDVIPVKTLSVCYGGDGSDAGTYPEAAEVAIGTNISQADVHVTGVAGNAPLVITCLSEQDAVYAALLPTSELRTFRFTVSNSAGTYSGTAKATLNEGEYVVATGLKLNEQ